MVTVGTAIGISFPVVPLESWNRSGSPACGTGMCAFHVYLPIAQRESAVRPYLSETEKSTLKSCALSGLDNLEQIVNIWRNGTIAPRTGSTGSSGSAEKKVLAMLTVAISVLFGLIAFAALAQIGSALDRG